MISITLFICILNYLQLFIWFLLHFGTRSTLLRRGFSTEMTFILVMSHQCIQIRSSWYLKIIQKWCHCLRTHAEVKIWAHFYIVKDHLVIGLRLVITALLKLIFVFLKIDKSLYQIFKVERFFVLSSFSVFMKLIHHLIACWYVMLHLYHVNNLRTLLSDYHMQWFIVIVLYF